MSISPDRLILFIGTAFVSAARSILPIIDPEKSGSLIGVLRANVISKGLPASSKWNRFTLTVVLSMVFPFTKISELMFIF